MSVPSYPPPPRNPACQKVIDLIIDPCAIQPGHPLCEAAYARAMSAEARTYRSQYISLEEELEGAFQYVAPANDNGRAYSVKFGEVIKNAANVYELLSRSLYERIYLYNHDDGINIFNYLSLDIFLDNSKAVLNLAACFDSFPDFPEVKRPFVQLATWNGGSLVQSDHIPKWWTAYNKIKHSNDGLKEHATLANAIAAVSAIQVFVNRVYGFGIVAGGLQPRPNGSIVVAGFSRLYSPP